MRDVRMKRQCLWNSALENRKRKEEVALLYDKMKINGVINGDEATNQHYPVTDSPSNTGARTTASLSD